MDELPQMDEAGRVRMIEVGDKPPTWRQAIAACRIKVGEKVFPLLLAGRLPKGEVWAAARLAGIMAAKNTAQIVPLCHPLPLTGVSVEFTPEPDHFSVVVQAQVRAYARTGVEMEALTAAAAAALTIYDMCKAVDRGLVIQDLQLLEKTGGVRGDYRSPFPTPSPAREQEIGHEPGPP